MITILVNILVFVAAQAQAADLHWVQLPSSPQKLVIAVEDGQSPEAALAAYIEEMEADAELKPFVEELKEQRVQDLRWGQIETSSDKNVLLLANKVEDMTSNPERVMSFQSTLEEADANVYVLPVAGLKALSKSEYKSAVRLISDKMDVVTAMGGADVSPDLYGRYNTYSRGVLHERDVWEAKLLKEVIEQEKAFVFGVCRGHQLIAITQGFSLVQDIPSFVKESLDHVETRHDIEIDLSKHNLLSKLSGQSGTIEVNSIHHQAVKLKESTKLEPVAYSPDGIVEAFEFKNGKGLTVQFHPELMAEQWAKDLLKNVVKKSGSQKKSKCDSLLSAS